jgi:hypothetical protein
MIRLVSIVVAVVMLVGASAPATAQVPTPEQLELLRSMSPRIARP